MKGNIFFIGIGGIGMSALARFYLAEGWNVAGYDKTPSPITEDLEHNGVCITYVDAVSEIPHSFKDSTTLVVYTPAIPTDSKILSFYKNGNFSVVKRSVALGKLSNDKYLMAVAGSHGKSTTSTLASYINAVTFSEGSAFLGAISKNFSSNLVIGKGNKLVVEADEFDRSFLQLRPNAVVITAIDSDHLDIYHTPEEYSEGFAQFIECIKPGGKLIVRDGIDVNIRNNSIDVFSYSLDGNDGKSDYYAENIICGDDGYYTYDIVTPSGKIKGCRLGVRGKINIENSIAAVALTDGNKADEILLKKALQSFSGIKRRFDFYVDNSQKVYMDDYAHHPGELSSMLDSVRDMFPDRKITIAFQPHLYTRTRDFAEGFSKSLSKADEVWLLPIYPAREQPIPGVCSEMLMKDITVPCQIVQYDNLLDKVSSNKNNIDIFITAGAGNIDRLVEPIADILNE